MNQRANFTSAVYDVRGFAGLVHFHARSHLTPPTRYRRAPVAGPGTSQTDEMMDARLGGAGLNRLNAVLLVVPWLGHLIAWWRYGHSGHGQ
jgi:hypothetical protein